MGHSCSHASFCDLPLGGELASDLAYSPRLPLHGGLPLATQSVGELAVMLCCYLVGWLEQKKKTLSLPSCLLLRVWWQKPCLICVLENGWGCLGPGRKWLEECLGPGRKFLQAETELGPGRK